MSTIHASAVLTGARAALIRGPSGAGKSRLAWALVEAGRTGLLTFARLVGDDRVHVEAAGGRLLVRPAPELAGMIEMRGLGIRALPHEPVAAVALVVDLAAADAARWPPPEASEAAICGLDLPRLAVAAGADPLPLVLGFLRGASAAD